MVVKVCQTGCQLYVCAKNKTIRYHGWKDNARGTINSEIFARVLFLRNFAYAKFLEKKILAKWQNHSVVY